MKKTLGFAAAVLLVGVVAGCSGSDLESVTVEATPQFLAESATRTAEDPTGAYETKMDQRVDGPGGQQISTDTTTTGLYDADAELVSGDLHQVVDGPTFQGEGDGEVVQDGPDLYVRGFPFTEAPFSADPDEWYLIELTEQMLAASGVNTSQAGFVSSPDQQLDMLLELAGEVEEVGRDEVRGLETTHLSTTYELPKAAVEAVEAVAPGVDVPTDVPLDVWVDDEGLIRRIESTTTIDTVTTSVVTEYFDFGVEVDITVPEDATPFEQLTEGLAEQMGDDQVIEDLEDEVEEQVQEAEDEGSFADDFGTAGGETGSGVPGLEPPEGMSEEMQEIAEQMAQLSPEELANDPCQVVEDPDLRAECEQYLPGG